MESSYKSIIAEEFERRKNKNSAYSMRAFAQHLGISRTALSEVLAGKRNFSKLSALKVCEKLKLTDEEKKSFLAQIKIDTKQIEKFLEKTKYKLLAEDEFERIASWVHIGVLCLPFLKFHSANAQWIAKKFQISELDAEDAIDRLIRLNLIEINNNKICRKADPIVTTRNIPSKAVREYHKKNLKLAEKKIEEVAIEHRLFNSITLTVNKNKIKEADDLINEFKQKFVNLMKTENPEDVYTLAIQFFPISNLEKIEDME